MPPEHDAPDHLTPVIYHTLLAVADQPRHGYAISREVAQITEGRITMGPGTLYGTLQRMSDNGWVRRTEVAEDDAPHAERRRYYELTPLGRTVLRGEAERLQRGVELARRRAILERP
jgi:DNA-binding PadR family transcriptional regulator